MNWFKRKPPLGTPENPEIIEPGDVRPRPRRESRTPRLPYLLMARWLLSAILPAVLLDVVCLWLVEAAHSGGAGPLAWLLLIFLSIPTFFANLAVVAVIVFGILFLTGRRVEVRGFMRR